MHEGKQHWLEEKVLAVLLLEGYIFCNEAKTDPNDEKSWTTFVFANCNDVFAWACADAEHVTNDDLIELYQLSRHKWGDVKWACKKRNMQPQKPMADDIKKDGCWDEVFESLPKNEYDD